MTHTAQWYLNRIDENVEAYFSGKRSYSDFGIIQRGLWQEADRDGVAEEVTNALRERTAA